MNKVIVVATDIEQKLAKQFFTLPVIKTGVGYGNIIEKLKDLNKDTKLINVGFAGSNNINVGSIIKVKNSYLYHPNVTYDEKVYNLNGEVDCYTSNDFVLKTDIKESVVFDMELYALCALGFDVTSYKIISDNLSLTDYEKLENQKIDLTKCWKEVSKLIGD